MSKARNIYGGKDPRDLPLYSATDASMFLHLPRSTVCAWAFGQRGFAPVLDVPAENGSMLTFKNLVELHVLAVLRRERGVALASVRSALLALRRELGDKHPLLSSKLSTDKNRRVFVDVLGKLINMSDAGQIEMREVIAQHLARISRDVDGVPVRLFPFTTSKPNESAKPVVIDPRVQFGKPVLAGTRVVTTTLAERLRAGDTVDALAKDYGRPKAEIEAALRYHIAA
jgi:uncharacterized protein (DUF433 family)